MNDEGFPIDETTRVVTFPCYILSSANEQGFVCMDIPSGGVAVALLTDPDSLARYRQEIGLPDRNARQFNTSMELLEALYNIPPAVTHIILDPTGVNIPDRDHRVLEINRFRERMRAKIG